MTTTTRTRRNPTRRWTQHLTRALSSPGNLLAGAGALALAAITWNPLPLVLYGIGEPVWLYNATSSQRYEDQLRAEEAEAARARKRRGLAWLGCQLRALLNETPCGIWTQRGRLPDYVGTYARLVEMRDQTAHIVTTRDAPARVLEEDIVARMDDMLRAYLMMVRERLLFHCALARFYPQLAELDGDRGLGPVLIAPSRPVSSETAFVSLANALDEVRAKIRSFDAALVTRPQHEEVYRPLIETLGKRLADLERRGKNDLDIAAQLEVFPDQFEIILSKLATPHADVGEVVDDMKLLIEQTDDTVSFAEDMRTSDRSTIERLEHAG